MNEKIAHYGLRVMADYSSVVFPVGKAEFLGQGKFDGTHLVLAGNGVMTISGDVAVEIEGNGRLAITVDGATCATMMTVVKENNELAITYSGTSDCAVRLLHTVQVARGAVYHERIAAAVHGLFDASTTVTHAGAAVSDLVTKVAVFGGGKAIVRGKIVMGKGAEGSKGAERIDALLLGQRAEADVLPTLVVDTDDVACKHAASVGHIDQNALFYLASRGIAPDDGRQLLTEAFLKIV